MKEEERPRLGRGLLRSAIVRKGDTKLSFQWRRGQIKERSMRMKMWKETRPPQHRRRPRSLEGAREHAVEANFTAVCAGVQILPSVALQSPKRANRAMMTVGQRQQRQLLSEQSTTTVESPGCPRDRVKSCGLEILMVNGHRDRALRRSHVAKGSKPRAYDGDFLSTALRRTTVAVLLAPWEVEGKQIK